MNQPAATRVTLNDVLRLVLPLSTTVVGSVDTERTANWVSILTEFEALEGQLQAGDIVIVPPALQEQEKGKDLAESLPELARLGVSALFVFRSLGDETAQKAAESGLPVLVISGNVTLREVHQGVAGLLVDRQKQIVERGMQLYRRLTELSREGQGLTAMADVMARLTGKIVAVQDKRLEILAITCPPDSPVEAEAARVALSYRDSLPAELRDRKEVAASTQSHWQQLLTVGELRMARLVSPIISGDRARGYVSVVGRPDELDLLDALTAEHGAAACALEMAKAKAISEAKKALRGNFLEGLLAGTLPSKEIERLAGRLDHDTGRRHAILVFAWDGDETPSLRRLESPLNWLLSSHNRPALTHIYSDDHVCVFQALEESDQDMATAVELARRLREHLRAEFPRVRLLSGLSGPAETLADWPRVHRQAVQAMQLARRLQLDSVVEFDHLGIFQLLTQLEDLAAVRRFCDQIIGPLASYDRQHRSTMVDTLNAYFNHNGNISQTAEALYIHRNTLLYRLERIQELTGQDLDQADTRLALHLALKLWQLRPDPGA